MAWDGLNRRKFPRIVYPCLVKVKSQEKENAAFLTHTENISSGGICVIIRQEIKLFTHVEVEIDLLDETEHVFSEGRVVWMVRRKESEKHKPLFYDIGIEFENLKEKEKARLEVSISQCIQKGIKILKPVY